MIVSEYIPAYASQGFQPVIVHAGPDVGGGIGYCLDNGVAFPMLLDADNSTLDVLQQTGPDSILFPLAYLIDREGTVRHVYNQAEPPGEYSPETLIEDLEALLAE